MFNIMTLQISNDPEEVKYLEVPSGQLEVKQPLGWSSEFYSKTEETELWGGKKIMPELLWPFGFLHTRAFLQLTQVY